ncbi:MAG TPA: flagellin lysine-N-methylase [Acidobacteriota bacterium]|nr:flagellin lysine-N-methylase [Acidobacteriota bacterium]
MDRHLVLLDYLAGFACLGTACPHICCITDWIIEIDHEHFVRLRAAMAAHPADQRILDTRFPADPEAIPPIHRLVAAPGSRECPYLRSDHLCRLQVQYGEDLLPLVCRKFPRRYHPTARGLLMRDTLACPESTRLALVAVPEPTLLRLTPASGPGALADPASRWRSTDEPDPADRYAARILEILWELLEPGRHAVDFALFLAGTFAQRLAVTVAEADAGPTADRLAAEADRLADPAWLDRMRRSFADSALVGYSALHTAWTLLAWSARRTDTPYGPFIRAALDSYPGTEPRPIPGIDGRENVHWNRDGAVPSRWPTAATLAGYRRRRVAVESVCPGRVAGYWRRYSRHALFGAAPLNETELMGHLQTLAVHLATFSVLLHGLTDVCALAGEGGPRPADPAAALDAAVTETVTQLSRCTIHNAALQAEITSYVYGLGAFGMPFLLTLLYFLDVGDGTARDQRPDREYRRPACTHA